MAKPQPGRGDAEDVESYATLSIKPVRLQRVAGEKPGPAAPVGADRGFLSGRTQMVTRQPVTARVAEDNAAGRLRDMDVEGRDIDFIIPGPWAYGAPALAPAPRPGALPRLSPVHGGVLRRPMPAASRAWCWPWPATPPGARR